MCVRVRVCMCVRVRVCTCAKEIRGKQSFSQCCTLQIGKFSTLKICSSERNSNNN